MIEAIFLGTVIPLFFLIIVLKGENRLLIAFFLWGLIAYVLSLSSNNMIIKYFNFSPSQLSVTWAPILEELFKALPLVYFLIKSKNNNFPIIFFALTSGISFSIQENYLYLFDHYGTQGSPVLYIIIRSVTTCLMHGISSAILGFGIQTIRKLKLMTLPFLFGLFSLSVTLHSLYNLYINSSLKLLGMVLPIMLYILGMLILMSEDETDNGDKRVIQNTTMI